MSYLIPKRMLHDLYIRWCSSQSFSSNTTGGTSAARTAYPHGPPEFFLGFSWVGDTRCLVFCVVFCRSLFVILFFFFWPLCCLSFFDLLILITPFVSSNSSCIHLTIYLSIWLSICLYIYISYSTSLWRRQIKVITKLPNSEQSYKGKVKTHNYINRQNQSRTGKLWKP